MTWRLARESTLHVAIDPPFDGSGWRTLVEEVMESVDAGGVEVVCIHVGIALDRRQDEMHLTGLRDQLGGRGIRLEVWAQPWSFPGTDE